MTDGAEILFKSLKLILLVFLFAHWLACIFWVVGITSID